MPKKNHKKQIKIVVLEDSLPIRETIKLYLDDLVRNSNYDIKIYTSEDGVEGLGYVFITDPDIIIIDSTLPKYSGKEIEDYLISNENFIYPEKKVILLDNGTSKLKNLPSSFDLINKEKESFWHDLKRSLSTFLNLREPKPNKIYQSIINLAKRGEKRFDKAKKANMLTKPFYYLIWLFYQISLGILLSVNNIFKGKKEDDNIQQVQKDNAAYRTRYYPTLATTFAGAFIFILQIGVYLSGGTFLISFLVSDTVAGVFPNGYSYRRSITVDSTKVSGVGDLTNFPIVVDGTYSYLATTLNGGKVESGDGFDIIFTSDSDGLNKLDHEIEKYNGGTGEIVAWIEVPTLSGSTNTDIYMFYGNNSVLTSQENAEGVWDSNYVLVQHLNETTVGNMDFQDSTSNSNDSSSVSLTGTNSDPDAAGIVNGAVQFDSSVNDTISIPDSNSLDVLGDMTIEAWFNPSAIGSNQAIAFKKNSSSPNNAYSLRVAANNNFQFTRVDNTGTSDTAGTFNTPITANNWWYGVGRYTTDTLDVLLNGSGASTFTATNATAGNVGDAPLFIGTNNIVNIPFDGVIDEIRISNISRSDEWIETTYNSISDNAFYSIAAEEEGTIGSGNIEVFAFGSQTSPIVDSSTSNYVGGGFNIISDTTQNITSIQLTEVGSIDADAQINNVAITYDLDTTLPYDCADQNYDGNEPQFGTNSTFNASNEVTFTDSLELTSTSAMCVYALIDLPSTLNGGEIIDLTIADPINDVLADVGTVITSSEVNIDDSSTVTNFISNALEPDWYSTSWLFRKGITIDSTFVDSNLSNQAVLLRIDDSHVISNMQGDADDVLFTDADGTTKLNHEIERYDSTNSITWVWVNVPFLSSSQDAKVFIYYDNTSATNQESINATWDSNPGDPIFIHHFEEDDRNFNLTNSTSNSGTNNGEFDPGLLTSGNVRGDAGQIDRGIYFNGSSHYLTEAPLTSNYALSTSGASVDEFTISLWFSLDREASVDGQPNGLIQIPGQNGSGNSIQVYVDHTDNKLTLVYEYTDGTTETLKSSTSIVRNIYYQMQIINTGSNLELFIDNVSEASASISKLGNPFANSEVWLGRSTGFLDGRLDEFRFYKEAVSAAQLKFEYENMSDSQATYAFQNLETPPGTEDMRINSTQSGVVRLNRDDNSVKIFSVQERTSERTITSVTINESGTVDAQRDLNNVRLYYDNITGTDCSVESYDGSEPQFGNSAEFDGADGTVTFTDTVTKNTTGRLCFYLVFDVQSSPDVGETVEFSFQNKSDFDTDNGTVFFTNLNTVPYTFFSEVISQSGQVEYTISSLGSQINILEGDLNHVGGGIGLISNSNADHTITSIKLTASGSVDIATQLDKVRLYYDIDSSSPYDCTDNQFDGDELKYGTTQTFDGSGEATFTENLYDFDNSQMVCFYPVIDVIDGQGDTLEISIADPTFDITTVEDNVYVRPEASINISGTTTLVDQTETYNWYDSNWNFRKEIIIPSNQTNCSDELHNFQFYLVENADANLQSNALANGDDIFFVNEYGLKIPHVFESYSSGSIEAWVKIPHLYCDRDTRIFMYYGNSGASNQEDQLGVWSNHLFANRFSNTTTADADFEDEANGNTAIGLSSMPAGNDANVPGRFGSGLSVDNTTNYRLGFSNTQYQPNIPNESFTFSAWVKPQYVSNQRYSYFFNLNSNGGYYLLSNERLDSDNTLNGLNLHSRIIFTGDNAQRLTTDNPLVSNTSNWVQIVSTINYRTGETTMYVDGVKLNSFTTQGGLVENFSDATGNPDNADNNTLDLLTDGSGNRFNGEVDHMRIIADSLAEDSDGWVATELLNAQNGASASNFGTEFGNDQILITTSGTQATSINVLEPDSYIGAPFVIYRKDGNTTLNSITVRETGSLDEVADLQNLKLFYEIDSAGPFDCSSEGFDGNETQFGSTKTDGFTDPGGSAIFTDSVGIVGESAMCIYTVFDLNLSGFGKIIDLEIETPDSLSFSGGEIVMAQIPQNLNGSTSVTSDLPVVTIDNSGTLDFLYEDELNYVGGRTVLTLDRNSVTLNSIKFKITGTVNPNTQIDDYRVYYEYDNVAPLDCTDQSFEGVEPKYGVTTDPDLNGEVTFTEDLNLDTSQALCLYSVFDVIDGQGDSYNIEITDTNTDILASGTVREPLGKVEFDATGTLQDNFTNPHPWYDNAWSSRAEAKVNLSELVCTGEEEFYRLPVLFDQDNADLNSNIQPDGDDLLFTNIYGTKLDHELEFKANSNWYDTNWNFRKSFVIDSTRITSNLTNQVMLFEIDDSDIVGNTQANAEDLVFTLSDGTTKLDHEIEVVRNNVIWAWVKIPNLSSTTDTEIYAYFDNPIAANQENVFATWDESNINAVYIHHLEELTTESPITNSTNNNNFGGGDFNKTVLSNTSNSGTDSIIDNGIRFNGSTERIKESLVSGENALSLSSSPTDEFSISFWINQDKTAITAGRIMQLIEFDDPSSGSVEGIELYLGNSDNKLRISYFNNIFVSNTIFNQTGIDYHLQLILNGTTLELYVNNVLDDTFTLTSTPPSSYPSTGDGLAIGNILNESSNGFGFDGFIDEFRYYQVAPGADKRTFEYENMSDPQSFIKEIEGLTKSPAPNSNFVTADSSSNTVIAWINIPHIYCDRDTSFFVYYNNPTATNQENAQAVWDDYAFVSHLADTPPTDDTDSTSFAELGQTDNNDVVRVDNGIIGSAYYFDGNNDRVAYNNTAADSRFQYVDTDEVTITAWINQDSADSGTFSDVVRKGIFTGGQNLELRISDLGTFSTQFGDASSSASTVTTNQNQYLGLSATLGSDIDYYLNGNNDVNRSHTGASVNNGAALVIGYNYGSSASFHGVIDEVRIRNSRVSDGWMSSEYNNVISPRTFITLDNIESENNAPVLTSVTLNSGNDINLVEGTTTSISVTALVTDTNGFADISTANGKIYRSGVTSGCSADDNNCYEINSCSITGCSGNSCTVTCSANIQFHADPTNIGAFAGENWEGEITVLDSQSASDTSTSTGVELNNLRALDLANSIGFGTVFPGDNTGNTNQTMSVVNTGNSSIDVNVGGEDLCTDYPSCTGGVIISENQEYDLLPFTYGNGTQLTQILSLLDISILKPNQSPSNQSGSIYWGIQIPLGILPGVYSGEINVEAIQNN